MTKTNPLIDDFESDQEELAYSAWLREKVQAAVDDERPRVPHDQVLAKVQAVIAAHKKVA